MRIISSIMKQVLKKGTIFIKFPKISQTLGGSK